jgi:hypothetical protein
MAHSTIAGFQLQVLSPSLGPVKAIRSISFGETDPEVFAVEEGKGDEGSGVPISAIPPKPFIHTEPQ